MIRKLIVASLMLLSVVGCAANIDKAALLAEGAGDAVGILSVLPGASDVVPDDNDNTPNNGDCDNCYGTGRSGDGHSVCQVCKGTGKTAVQELAESLYEIVSARVVEIHAHKLDSDDVLNARKQLKDAGFIVKLVRNYDNSATWYKVIGNTSSVRVDGAASVDKLIEIHKGL